MGVADDARPFFPSTSSTNVAFSAGTSPSALTTAYPIRWVKLTFAPVVRASWLFRICRLTSSSRAGTVRTLVAVGTARLASMLATIRDAAPRNGTATSPPSAAPSAHGRRRGRRGGQGGSR